MLVMIKANWLGLVDQVKVQGTREETRHSNHIRVGLKLQYLMLST
jgi:hypothetical protein